MSRIPVWLTLSALLFTAQSAGGGSLRQRQFEFRHVSIEEGLSQSSVSCIFQDRQGFMWFGTGDGLNKFDGYSITAYRSNPGDSTSLVGGVIRAICEDTSGAIWVGSDEGLVRYDRETSSFRHFSTHMPQWQGIVGLAADSSGVLWIGTPIGLFRMSDGDTVPRPVYRCQWMKKLLMVDGRRFLLAVNDDLLRFDAATGEVATCNLNSPTKSRSSIVSLFRESDSRVDAVSFNGDIYSIENIGGNPVGTPRGAGLRKELGTRTVNCLSVDGEGRLWVGTDGDGVIAANEAPFSVRHLRSDPRDPRSLSANIVKTMFRDRSGLIWLGTDLGGVSVIDPYPKKFGVYRHDPDDPNSLSGNAIEAVTEDKSGSLWVGTFGDGLNRISADRNAITCYKHSSADRGSIRSNNLFSLLFDSRERLWVGTTDGLDRFDPSKGEFLHYEGRAAYGCEPGKIIQAISETPDGRILVGTDLALAIVDESEGVYRPLSSDTRLLHTKVRCIRTVRGGSLYIGAGGVIRLNGSSMLVTGVFNPMVAGRTTFAPEIMSIEEDPTGVIWVASNKGVYRLDAETGRLTRFGTESGIASGMVYGILADRNGALWLSTNGGISRFNPASGEVRNFGVEDGVQSDEFNRGAFYRSKSGEMFFGGVNGMNAFFPDSVRDNPRHARPVLTGFKKFDEPVSLGSDISSTKEITLQYGENIFSLQFAGLEFTDPSRNRYAYKLDGFEKNWTECGTRREVRYTRLDPGRYVFRVRAANNDGVWNDEELAVAITIIPPYWQTMWFRITAILGITGVVVGTTRYAIRRTMLAKIEKLERQHALDRERSRISQDMHDEVGASLTKIAILTELARRNLDERSAASPQIEKISQTSREVLKSIGEIIWATNPKHAPLAELVAYIREYALEFLEAASLRPVVAVDEDPPTLDLSAEQRRNIFLVVKEALANIAKHASATSVELRIDVSDDLILHMTIRDDGIGFDQGERRGTGNGLTNMPRRVGEIRGQIAIHSEKGHGTTIDVTVPLRNTTFV